MTQKTKWDDFNHLDSWALTWFPFAGANTQRSSIKNEIYNPSYPKEVPFSGERQQAAIAGDCDSAGAPPLNVAKRIAYTSTGIVFVAIGFVGIALPGIPTTGPLLLASFLLARGNPKLERILVRNRVFRNYLRYFDGSATIPLSARIWSIAWMWVGILFSSIVVRNAEYAPTLISIFVVAGVLGTTFISSFRRKSDSLVRSQPVSLTENQSFQLTNSSSQQPYVFSRLDQSKDLIVLTPHTSALSTERKTPAHFDC